MTTRERETHKTAAIRRAPRDTPPSGTAAPTTGILRDLTSPIPVERRLFAGVGQRTLLILGGTAVLVALIAAIFVLPVQAWMKQRDDLERRRTELAVLQDANAQLASEVARLKTKEGIVQAAREELGFIQRGEQRITMVAAPAASAMMPTGWPFNTVNQILSVRIGELTAKPVAAPDPVSEPPAERAPHPFAEP